MRARTTKGTDPPTLLGTLLPTYSFCHAHIAWVNSGDPGRVLEIARDIPLGRSKWISTLFRLRCLPSPARGSQAFIQAMGWTDLGGDAPSEFVVGYVQGDRERRVKDASEFVRATGRRKVAFAIRTTRISRDIVELSTETRVLCSDRRQNIIFWFYWMLIRPFSGLVRSEMLRLVKDAAEGDWHAETRNAEPPEVVAKLPRPWLLLLRACLPLASRAAPALTARLLGTAMLRIPYRPLSAGEERFLSSGRRRCLAFGADTVTSYSFGSGRTVVLLHGLLGSSADFRHLIPAITACGFNALAIDWRNHGRSPRGPILSRDSIRNLSQLLARITDLHAVVGHSAGAYFAMLAMANMRESGRHRLGVFISAPTSISTSIRATMNYLRVPRSVYCDVCRWFECTLDLPMAALDLTAHLPGEDRWSSSNGWFLVHDPFDRYAPYSDVERLAQADSRVSLVARPMTGHFKLLKDELSIDAVCRFLLGRVDASARSKADQCPVGDATLQPRWTSPSSFEVNDPAR